VKQPQGEVTLAPPSRLADSGEAAIRPKPRGIVLRPLNMPQPGARTPDEDHAPSAPEPVGTSAPASAEVGDPGGISLEVLREELAASLAEALFLEREEVRLDNPFIEMGLDSIVAAEWVRALNARYGTKITVTKVYDYPTILALATFVSHELEAHAQASRATRPALDDVLQSVQQGRLDIAQAYELLQQHQLLRYTDP
jgi:acyl carrier protein